MLRWPTKKDASQLGLLLIAVSALACSEPPSRGDAFGGGPDSGAATDGADEDADTDYENHDTSGTETGSETDAETDAQTDRSAADEPATGVRIVAVQANQGVGIDIAADGQTIPMERRTGTLIHGRKTQIRATWQLDPGSPPRTLYADLELTFPDGRTELLTAQQRADANSRFDVPGRSFEWILEPSQVVPGLTYEIRLLEAASGAPDMRPSQPFPVDGPARLGLDPADLAIRVVAIPVTTPTGGIVATSEFRQKFEDNLRSTFPVQTVEVTWRDPWVRTAKLTEEQDAWDYMFDARTQDAAGVAYYHLLLDADTCCVETEDQFAWGGLGELVDTDDIAAGFYGGAISMFREYEDADGNLESAGFTTVTHELGHNHGRIHSPCNSPDFVDADYPHHGGLIGSVGFDVTSEQTIFPGDTDVDGDRPADFMGYCSNRWWSDYSWNALYQRVKLRSRLHAHVPRLEGLELRGYVRPSRRTVWRIVPGLTSAPNRGDGPTLLLLETSHGPRVTVPTQITRHADSDTLIIRANISAHPDFRSVELELDSVPLVAHRGDIQTIQRR